MSGNRKGWLFTLPLPVRLVLRFLIGGTFVYASFDKIAHPDGFAQSVFYYRMVPEYLLHLFAIGLPWLELVAGLALMTGFRRRGAALLIAMLTVTFFIAITSALARDLDISCGCFNTGEGHSVGIDLLIRNSLMFLGCLLIILQRRPKAY